MPTPAVICQLCGHTQHRVLFEKEFKVLLCRNCGLIFLAGDPRDYKKYYTEDYDYRLREDGHFVDDAKVNQAIFEWVMKNLPATENIALAEIGCSAGFLLKRFRDYGIGVFGIEPGKKAAEFARQVNGLEVECGMLDDVEGGVLYDAVILIQTLEHFSDPLASLFKIRGMLKEGGFLFIEVPNYYAPNGFYLLKIKGVDYPSPNHLFVYTRKTLGAFLSRAGFSVCHTSYTLQNVRVVAKMNGSSEPVEFESYCKALAYFHMLPLINKAIDVFRFFKSLLIRTVTLSF